MNDRMRFDGTNVREILEWMDLAHSGPTAGHAVWAKNQRLGRELRAEVGEWVVRDDTWYHVEGQAAGG